MAQTCNTVACSIKPENAVLLIAPCDTIPRVAGKPVVDQALIDSMYRLLLCGPFDYNPDVTTNKRKKVGGCGGTSCTTTINGFELTLPIEVCPDDPWTLELTAPHIECTFDFIFFPYPTDCAAPLATDVFWVGTAKAAPSAQTYDPDADEDLIVEVTAVSCEYPLCVLNDVTDTTTAPLITGKESEPLLNTGKKAA